MKTQFRFKDFLSARISLTHPSIAKTLAAQELGEFAFNCHELPRPIGLARDYSSRLAAQEVIKARRMVTHALDQAIDSVLTFVAAR